MYHPLRGMCILGSTFQYTPKDQRDILFHEIDSSIHRRKEPPLPSNQVVDTRALHHLSHIPLRQIHYKPLATTLSHCLLCL